MAIQRPLIEADPAGSFNRSFTVADSATRAYAEQIMRAEEQARRAVQQQRENMANDFKLQLAAIGTREDIKNNTLRNRQQDEQIEISRYNADTARMNAGSTARRAAASRRSTGDPLGLRGGGGSTVDDGDMGAPPDDGLLEDLDLPAGGTFGEGIDADVSSKNNPALLQLQRDLEAQQVGELPADAPRTPDTSLLLPGGPEGATGSTGMSGPAAPPPRAEIVPDVIPRAEIVPDAGPAPVQYESTIADPVIPRATVVPETPEVAAGGPVVDNLLPPPQMDVPSFSDIDVTKDVRRSLDDLNSVNAGLTKRASLATSEAARIHAMISRGVDADLIPAYKAKADEQETLAEKAAAASREAQARAVDGIKKVAVLQERQDKLASLSTLDGILPDSDRQELIKLASDSRTGGLADRKIKTLQAYDQVRQTFGLTHASNGSATAEQVVRTGLLLATPEATKAKDEAQSAKLYRKLIEDNEKAPADKQKDEKIVAVWEAKMNEAIVGEMKWQERETAFERAVKNDTRKMPEVEEGEVPPPPGTPAAAPAEPAKPLPPIPAKAADVMGADPLPDAPETWTAIKQQLVSRNPGLMEDLKAIAKEKPQFRAQAVRNALNKITKLGKVDGGTLPFAKVDRTGNNLVNMEEAATAVLGDLMRSAGAVPAKIGGWTVTEKRG